LSKVLRNRDFLLLWIGQSISGLGTWINFIGLNLYIYHIFGSGKILGLFLVVRMLPALLFGSFGGYLADRYSCKRIMIICDILRAVLVLAFLWANNIYVFFVIGLILSALDKFFTAARGALIPAIIEKDLLLEANSISRMTNSIIMILGPAVGGILVAAFSYKSVFVIDSFTFVASVISISFISGYALIPRSEKSVGFIEEFRVTFQFFRGHALLVFLTMVRLIDALGSGAYNTALPIFSREFSIKRASSYGWLIGAWAMGAFTGSLLVNYISKKVKFSNENIFSFSVIIMAVGMGLTFHTGHLYYALAAIFFGGVGDGISSVLLNTALMKESPEGMRGKIFGTSNALLVTSVAVGMGVSGFFLDIFPLSKITDFCSYLIVAGVIIGYLFFILKKRSDNERKTPF